MDPHLSQLQKELSSAVAGLTDQQWSACAPGKWCTAELLEHLYLTYTGTTKGFQRLLDAGEPKVSAPTWKQRAGAVLVFGFAYLPSGRESPAMARPKGLPTEKVREEIGAKIAEMDAILSTCESKFGAERKVLDHAILGPLTVNQWRKFHLVHGRHHIKQMQRLRGA
jgi:DinB superfamily